MSIFRGAFMKDGIMKRNFWKLCLTSLLIVGFLTGCSTYIIPIPIPI